MRLTGPDGQSLELWIAGYQFPHMEAEEYDANWLIIQGTVSHVTGSWTFRDPCLLTQEVVLLADWLEAAAHGREPYPEISFLEPNLEFHLRRDGDTVHLRVYFELEARPDWAAWQSAGMRDCWINFPLQPADLMQTAQSLREQLGKYPQRAVRSLDQAEVDIEAASWSSRGKRMKQTVRVFNYIEELDAFLVTEEYRQLADRLGLTEWHPAVWIGRLFILDEDYGEHWFDNWDEREALEPRAEALGIDASDLMVINPEWFAFNGDGPCNPPEIRKAFWTDVLQSLELSYDLLFQKARLANARIREILPDEFIEDLEARIAEIEAGLREAEG